jgi:tRNA G18 (ribose-2'-O)-methylase SpoU
MITSVIKIYTENNDFQHIETLRRNRTKRHKSKEFFVEGVRSINQAIKNEWEINAFIFTREKRLSDWANNIIETSKAKKHFELSFSLLEKLSEKDNVSELIALVSMPEGCLSRIPESEDFLAVVLDRIASPGNLGTIIRSCDALGVDGLIMTGHSTDLYAPETIRAAAGSFFAVPVIQLPSHNDLLPWLVDLKSRIKGLQIVGTSSNAILQAQNHDFKTPTVLLVGNENHGLSANYKSLSDFMVTIPMFGSASSMNVACAVSIFLYEISRQRNESGFPEESNGV